MRQAGLVSKRREAVFVELARDGEVEAGERVGALELTAGVTSGYRMGKGSALPPARRTARRCSAGSGRSR
jgi:hypothetical protein